MPAVRASAAVLALSAAALCGATYLSATGKALTGTLPAGALLRLRHHGVATEDTGYELVRRFRAGKLAPAALDRLLAECFAGDDRPPLVPLSELVEAKLSREQLDDVAGRVLAAQLGPDDEWVVEFGTVFERLFERGLIGQGQFDEYLDHAFSPVLHPAGWADSDLGQRVPVRLSPRTRLGKHFAWEIELHRSLEGPDSVQSVPLYNVDLDQSFPAGWIHFDNPPEAAGRLLLRSQLPAALKPITRAPGNGGHASTEPASLEPGVPSSSPPGVVRSWPVPIIQTAVAAGASDRDSGLVFRGLKEWIVPPSTVSRAELVDSPLGKRVRLRRAKWEAPVWIASAESKPGWWHACLEGEGDFGSPPRDEFYCSPEFKQLLCVIGIDQGDDVLWVDGFTAVGPWSPEQSDACSAREVFRQTCDVPRLASTGELESLPLGECSGVVAVVAVRKSCHGPAVFVSPAFVAKFRTRITP
jgi:hypothetical protein